MWDRIREHWLPRLLFSTTLLVAASILVLVFLAPTLNEAVPNESPVMTLFADDAAVRRTAIAGGVGLIVTAFVFFRPGLANRKTPKKPPQDTMAGA